jgi:hypothetical protein
MQMSKVPIISGYAKCIVYVTKIIRIILLILDFKLGTIDNRKDYLQTWGEFFLNACSFTDENFPDFSEITQIKMYLSSINHEDE